MDETLKDIQHMKLRRRWVNAFNNYTNVYVNVINLYQFKLLLY